MIKFFKKGNIKFFKTLDKNNLGSLARIFLSSFVVIFVFYSLPLVINFTNNNILNSNEHINNSKVVLAYTLDKKANGNSEENDNYNERDLLVDIYSLNEQETDTVRLDASTIKQLYEDTDIIDIPSWKDIVYDFEVIDGQKLSKIDKPLIPTRFTKAITFKTFTVDQSYYLKWLTDKLVNMGVQFERRKLNNIDEVCHDGYDIIVNCAGLGASELLSDTEMYPIRGQVLRLDAPFVENIYFFNKSYFIPNVDSLVVGGTAQKGDWSTEPRQEDTDRILNDAIAFFPQIATATIQNVWAGLRPGRTPLRLEMESKVKNETSNSKRRSRIIHNYGHGGSGVTIAWGCAQEVAEMIEQALPLMMPRARL